jgi:hypothetical protein
MRKFYLVNDKLEYYYFDEKDQALVTDVSGLGFEKDLNFSDYDNFYKKLNEKNPLGEIKLNLAFIGGYRGYKDFLNYVENSITLNFYYESDDLRYIDCEIVSLSKTQIVNGFLSCELTIKKLSYWFKRTTKEIVIDVDSDGKIYSYTYPYTYSDTYMGTVSIENKGYAKAPLKIVIQGAFCNPEILIKKDGVVISKCKIYYESDNAKIEIDSYPTNQKIEITEDGTTFNAYEYQDFTCENFIFLDKGTFDIEFKPNADTTPKCFITMIEGYLGN